MAQPQDAAAYYGDLLDSEKKPSRVMVALLTGIAKYIVKNLGDKDTKCLTPPKLAAFYKAVGGNYDSVFIDLPNPQISFIYQSIGCQHTLQPTEDDFHAPSIPALTTRGFVRWQTIEILLDPSGHVPFLQRAVHDFPILNPETGDRFPADLPASCLPQDPDAAIEKWHNKCAEKLRRDSAADERPRSQPAAHTPDSRHGSPYVKPSHTHPATSTPRDSPRGTDYFNPKPEPKPEHPRRQKPTRTTTHAPKPRDPPPRRPATPPLEYEDARGRRRSVPKDYYRNIPADSRPSKYASDVPQEGLRPHSGGPGGRRHSHPRHRRERSSSSSSWSSSSESVTTDPPTSPMYSARRASKAKEQQQQQQQQQQGKPRRGPKPTAVPFAGRYSASSSPHPDPVAAAASAAAAAAGGGLQNEKLRQDHRNRGLSMPNFRHAGGNGGGGPQIATYKIAVDPPPPPSAAAGGGPFTPSYPPNAWRSESRGGGANVRWRDLVDLDIPLGGWVKEPLAPDAPPAVGGGGMGGREKYRREEFGKRERRSVSHEERVRERERRREWERRERADSETDARMERRFGGKR